MEEVEQEFSGLTLAQKERLYLLAEEASEIIKNVTKILRFGYDSYNPYEPEKGSNLQQLITEMGDLTAVQRLMMTNGDFNPGPICEAADAKYAKLPRFLRQQHNF